ncbi:hypothetical protein [Myroides odoratimimus]|uniref:hypothetical protein n=1 Tax=Myroides odoratimimus TaxID=76832 RepID=UPI0025789689|nr:hypothetical protein [Myroides odoratimimus]
MGDSSLWIDPFGLACANTIDTHGNSKNSKNDQHGYVIFNEKTGDILEYGISGQKLNLDGSSPRVKQKIRTK